MRLMRTRYILSLSFAVYQNPKNILEQKQFGEAKKDEKYNGLNIIRTIPPEEMNELKKLHKGGAFTLPAEFQKAIAWFLMRSSDSQKKRTQKINQHADTYDSYTKWSF